MRSSSSSPPYHSPTTANFTVGIVQNLGTLDSYWLLWLERRQWCCSLGEGTEAALRTTVLVQSQWEGRSDRKFISRHIKKNQTKQKASQVSSWRRRSGWLCWWTPSEWRRPPARKLPSETPASGGWCRSGSKTPPSPAKQHKERKSASIKYLSTDETKASRCFEFDKMEKKKN